MKFNEPKNSSCFIVITAIMITCYIAANIMAVKLITVFDIALFDAGTITFPITFMLGDVLTEVWGFKTARKVILLTLLCNILLVAVTTIGVFLPSPDYMEEINRSYETIFTVVPRILIASLVAFVVGELANAFVMEKIKNRTGKKHLWLRTIGSSAIGYALDTVIFVLIAFIGTAKAEDLISMIIMQYILKMVIETVGATPIAYGVIAFVKKREAKNE